MLRTGHKASFKLVYNLIAKNYRQNVIYAEIERCKTHKLLIKKNQSQFSKKKKKKKKKIGSPMVL